MARFTRYPNEFTTLKIRGKVLVVPSMPGIAWLVPDIPLKDRFMAEVLPSHSQVELVLGTVLNWLENGTLELRDTWQAPSIPSRSSEFELLDKMAANLTAGV